MDRKASGLWVAHHRQADHLMPGLVDHFTSSEEFWNWETKRARSAAEAGPLMRVPEVQQKLVRKQEEGPASRKGA